LDNQKNKIQNENENAESIKNEISNENQKDPTDKQKEKKEPAEKKEKKKKNSNSSAPQFPLTGQNAMDWMKNFKGNSNGYQTKKKW